MYKYAIIFIAKIHDNFLFFAIEQITIIKISFKLENSKYKK